MAIICKIIITALILAELVFTFFRKRPYGNIKKERAVSIFISIIYCIVLLLLLYGGGFYN